MKGSNSIHKRISRYAQTDTHTLYRELQISDKGYTDEKAEESRKKHGDNVLSGRATRPSQKLCKPPTWCRIEGP